MSKRPLQHASLNSTDQAFSSCKRSKNGLPVSARSSLNQKFSASHCIAPSEELLQRGKDLEKSIFCNDTRYKQFTQSQRDASDAALEERANVFITGSAGTGKTHILKFLIDKIIDRFGKDSVGVTAPTGLAAVNIGGDTVHSFACINSCNGVYKLTADRTSRTALINRWKKLKVFVIDEISMLDGNLFSMIDQLAQKVRNNSKPFGGVQVIVVGDFFQLPPVAGEAGPRPLYCFETRCWSRTIQRAVILKQIFRQHGDEEFMKLLGNVRMGYLTTKDKERLSSLRRPVAYEDQIMPPELYATRAAVERANRAKLDQLKGQTWEYEATDSGPQKYLARLKNSRYLEKLELKENCQVILLKNNKAINLFNGSMGLIKFFLSESIWRSIVSAFEHEELTGSLFSQCLAIVKPYVYNRKIDFSSQCTTSDSNPRMSSMLRRLVRAISSSQPGGNFFPVVQFKIGSTHKLELIKPDIFTIDSPTMSEPVYRTQLPLMLSWAMSIHKAQGQSLERVKVDLTNIFERGQFYVALSRAVSLRGLQVVGTYKQDVLGPPANVKSFYESLEKR